MNCENRRVAVTGLGVVSPVGSAVETAWRNLIDGFNGIGPITRFDTTNYKAKLGAEVRDFDPLSYMERGDVLHSDLFTQYAMGAAVQAVEESGVIEKICVTNGQMVEYGTELFRIRR